MTVNESQPAQPQTRTKSTRPSKRMNRKQKGISAEREIIHLFWEQEGWTACRVASSGATRYPAPDIFAAKNGRILAIECKSTSLSRVYISEDQITELEEYARRSGAESWIAVRFPGKKWYFLPPKELAKTPGFSCANQRRCELLALSFEDLVNLV